MTPGGVHVSLFLAVLLLIPALAVIVAWRDLRPMLEKA
jgi:hypothetical protein